jgi:predicted transposase/invertase (TIGR01784 family)
MKYRHEERAAELMERLYREEEGIMRAERYDATRTGHARGFKKGIKEGKLEDARKMKELGDSIERIQIITGLPLETIKQL